MHASISADSRRGPGYGSIEVRGIEYPGDAAFFVLQRASDGKYLSGAGWQESESPLPQDMCEKEAGGCRLYVGPTVIDRLDSLESYRLSLHGDACVLTVHDLAYSPMQGVRNVESFPATAPEPLPPQEEAPLQEAPAEPQAGDAPDEVLLPPPPTPQAPPPKKSRTGALFAAILLCLAAGLAGWMFLRSPEAPPLPEQKPEQEAQNPEQQAQAPEQQTPNPAEPGSEQTQPQPLSPLAAAREHLRGPAQPDASLDMAKPLRRADATPEQSDAAFLLLEDAAQKGAAEAMFLVGQYYDPAAQLPRGSIPTDLTQARRWYESALKNGHQNARPALDALKEYARVQKEKGDAEAAVLLQNWE